MAKIASARKTTLWVRTSAGVNDSAFTKLKTRTQIQWSSKRDEAKEDYQDATVKTSYTGAADVTGTVAISRTEDDIAYDALQEAHFANEEIEVQERDAAGLIVVEATVNVLEWTIAHGLNESSKVNLTFSVAGQFDVNVPGRAAVNS